MKKPKKRRYIVDLHSSPLSVPLDDRIMELFAVGAQKGRIRDPFISGNLATNTVDLSVGIAATGPARALHAAVLIFEQAVREARLGDTHASEASVELDTGAGPLRQELLTGAEVARRIGVSRQRVSQLASTHRFPKPVTNAGGYLVWRWGDILDWVAVNRRPTPKTRRLARSA
jgi:predicted DNA-binding transcriptional regulator AlpA